MSDIKLCKRCKEMILHASQHSDYRKKIADMYQRFNFLESEMERLGNLIEKEAAAELLKKD
jgi:hypothetical protein